MEHIIAQERTDVVSGIWKFARGVEAETLVSYALTLKEEEPDRYLDLHVRGCSREQMGIGFQYVFDEAAGERSYRKFFHRMTDKLKRRFGNDFIGWDISAPTWIIPV